MPILLDDLNDQQRAKYTAANNLSKTTDRIMVLHCRRIGGKFDYSWADRWDSWNNMEICRFRRGREIQ